jgi:hypothetical protein
MGFFGALHLHPSTQKAAILNQTVL